ncbi:transaldolase family protein [Mycetocola sp. 2940]|uniref:transaldolase family protein n=1 Tax=Mycetocola sp. 2940 TaxID=3156452 RepID=UPI0033968D82
MTTIRLYADSAERSAVTPLLTDGLITGVTTNPTILARSKLDSSAIPALYDEWLAAGAHEIFFQAWGTTADDLERTGRTILSLGERIVVKVPASTEGLRAAARLTRDGAIVLLTAVYSPGQAVAAAAIGARYVAPYLGRLQDAGRPGLDEIEGMHRLLEGTGCDVLVASLRTSDAISDLAGRGIRHFTADPQVVKALFTDPASDRAIVNFEAATADWEVWPPRVPLRGRDSAPFPNQR